MIASEVQRAMERQLICHDYRLQRGIKFNPQKSQVATFGGISPLVAVRIDDVALEWVDRVKYFGCYFVSCSGEFDITSFVGKFYGSFNNILYVPGKRRNDVLADHLVKTYCLPMLNLASQTS